MQTITDLLTPYAELESAVRQLMTGLFSETCGMCTACCCRADICEEAVESPFLAMLLEKQGVKASAMDERYGWLDLHGCSLEYGRPPVCYSFYCDELLDRLPDNEARYAAAMLGKLMHHIGLNALGGWHLVEIMDPADLNKVDLDIISRKLEESQAAFGVIEQFVQSGRLNSSDRECLAAITTEEP